MQKAFLELNIIKHLQLNLMIPKPNRNGNTDSNVIKTPS